MWCLDTNVFVYTFDAGAPIKQERAKELVKQSLSSGAGCVSAQVVNEFVNVALRKFEVPLKPRECADYLEAVLAPLCQVFWSPRLAVRALDLHEGHQISWYDSLIVAAALEAGCETLYSEDLQSGRRFGDLLVSNPFS